MKPHQLTADERAQLEAAYLDARERDSGASWRNGSHFILIHTLQTLGYSVRTSEQAENIAEKLIYGEE